MSTPVKTLRLFVACFPPPEVAQQFVDALEKLDVPEYRAVPLEQIHLTLQFIGATSPDELERTITIAKRASKGISPFPLQPLKLITIPGRGSIRIIAVESDAPKRLLELHRRHANKFSRQTRRSRFLPHFTLCRFAPPQLLPDLDQSSMEISIPAFTVDSLHLMRSTLDPEGAQHHLVKRFPLEAP